MAKRTEVRELYCNEAIRQKNLAKLWLKFSRNSRHIVAKRT